MNDQSEVIDPLAGCKYTLTQAEVVGAVDIPPQGPGVVMPEGPGEWRLVGPVSVTYCRWGFVYVWTWVRVTP